MTTRLSLKTETTIHHFDVRKVPVIGPAWRMVDLFRRRKRRRPGLVTRQRVKGTRTCSTNEQGLPGYLT